MHQIKNSLLFLGFICFLGCNSFDRIKNSLDNIMFFNAAKDSFSKENIAFSLFYRLFPSFILKKPFHYLYAKKESLRNKKAPYTLANFTYGLGAYTLLSLPFISQPGINMVMNIHRNQTIIDSVGKFCMESIGSLFINFFVYKALHHPSYHKYSKIHNYASIGSLLLFLGIFRKPIWQGLTNKTFADNIDVDLDKFKNKDQDKINTLKQYFCHDYPYNKELVLIREEEKQNEVNDIQCNEKLRSIKDSNIEISFANQKKNTFGSLDSQFIEINKNGIKVTDNIFESRIKRKPKEEKIYLFNNSWDIVLLNGTTIKNINGLCVIETTGNLISLTEKIIETYNYNTTFKDMYRNLVFEGSAPYSPELYKLNYSINFKNLKRNQALISKMYDDHTEKFITFFTHLREKINNINGLNATDLIDQRIEEIYLQHDFKTRLINKFKDEPSFSDFIVNDQLVDMYDEEFAKKLILYVYKNEEYMLYNNIMKNLFDHSPKEEDPVKEEAAKAQFNINFNKSKLDMTSYLLLCELYARRIKLLEPAL